MSSVVLQSALGVALAADVPVALRGDPGVGKTSMITATAAAAGWHLEVVVLSIREPADIGGFPVVDADGRVRLAPPAWAATANHATDGALVFLDELTTGSAATRHAALRVLQERVVGETPLAGHVRLATAYNDPEVCDGWELEPPVRSRLVHLDVDVDAAAFCAGLLDGWRGIPPPRPPQDLDLRIARANSEVAGFLYRRADLLAVRPQPGSTGGYPCPRSWTHASRLLGWSDGVGVQEEVAWALVTGCLGSGAAAEFMTWRTELDLPDPHAVLQDPSTHPLPDRPDQLLVTARAVVACAADDPAAWTAAWVVLERMAAGGTLDVAALVAPELLRRRPADTQVPASAHRVAEAVA